MDRLTADKRSWNMSRIRARNTRPEIAVRSVLHSLGYRFRVHRSDLPGTPDIVLPRYHTVILVHGCFWHRHTGCKFAYKPKTRVRFWMSKFRKNQRRDRETIAALRRQGWRSIVVWECEIGQSAALMKKLGRIRTPVRIKLAGPEQA